MLSRAFERFVVVVGFLLVALAPDAAAQETAAGSTVTADSVPLTSQHKLHGERLRRLPIDDPRASLFLVPGVVSRDLGWGVYPHGAASLRGSPVGEASVYIDGAPVRWETFGSDNLVPGLGSIEWLLVTTGVSDPSVGDARAGVLSYETRWGRDRLEGDFRAESDEFFGNGSIVGYNRFEGWAGGPAPGAPGLTWFVSGTAQGQRSQYRGMGAADVPAFMPGSIDTVVSDVNGESLVLPQYVQWSGECGGLGNGANPTGSEIRANHGYECQGLRRPMDWSSALRLHGKLVYSYGNVGRVSLTGLALGLQQRGFPGEVIGAPSLYRGSHVWSRLLVANWRHRAWMLGQQFEFRVNASYGSDRAMAGPLTPESEVEMRDPGLGIALPSLTFTGGDVFPYPINDQILRNVRTNTGLRVPYLDRDDLRNTQAGRINPYGLQGNGWVTQGLQTPYSLAQEQRWQGRGSLQWALDPVGVLTLGVEVGRTEASFYTSDMLSQNGMDLFIAEPGRFGLFVSDHLRVLGATAEVGLRYDRYSGGGLIPVTPGRTFSHPNFFALYPNAATDDAQYAAYLADPAIWREARDQALWSPRVRLTYPIGTVTTFRAGYGSQVETPSHRAAFAGLNNDLSFTAPTLTWGRDVEYAQSSLVELGVRHGFGPALALDAAVYWKDGLVPYGPRTQRFVNPSDPTDTLFMLVLARTESLTAVGVDVALDWRGGGALAGALAYTFQTVSPAAGETITTHNIGGSIDFTVPTGWREGSLVGSAARGVSATALFRFTNGAAYTRRINAGQGTTTADNIRFVGAPAEPLNASHLPWLKHVDLRLAKAWQVRGVDWSVYLDLRNLFNFRNQVDVFTETGDTANAVHRALLGAPELSGMFTEASANGALEPDGVTINVQGCGGWFVPVNCVSLQRVENRYGDGDGLYTPAEQQRAVNAFYDTFYGSSRFYQPGRTVRLGIEIGF